MLKDRPVESLNEGPCPQTRPAALFSRSSETVTSAEGFHVCHSDLTDTPSSPPERRQVMKRRGGTS